jgi:hypothetical protein
MRRSYLARDGSDLVPTRARRRDVPPARRRRLRRRRRRSAELAARPAGKVPRPGGRPRRPAARHRPAVPWRTLASIAIETRSPACLRRHVEPGWDFRRGQLAAGVLPLLNESPAIKRSDPSRDQFFIAFSVKPGPFSFTLCRECTFRTWWLGFGWPAAVARIALADDLDRPLRPSATGLLGRGDADSVVVARSIEHVVKIQCYRERSSVLAQPTSLCGGAPPRTLGSDDAREVGMATTVRPK